MQIQTSSGSAGAALGVIGTGLALALPDQRWIGWIVVTVGLFVFLFDVRIDGWGLRAAAPYRRLANPKALFLLSVACVPFLVATLRLVPNETHQELNVSPLPAPQVAQVSPAATPTTVPAEKKSPALRSTFSKLIFLCDKPAPAKKPSKKEVDEALRKYRSLMRGVFGVEVRSTAIEDGVRLDYDVSDSRYGADLKLTIKQAVEIRRYDQQQLYVTILTEFPDLYKALMMLAVLDKDTPWVKESAERIESLLGSTAGSCSAL